MNDTGILFVADWLKIKNWPLPERFESVESILSFRIFRFPFHKSIPKKILWMGASLAFAHHFGRPRFPLYDTSKTFEWFYYQAIPLDLIIQRLQKGLPDREFGKEYYEQAMKKPTRWHRFQAQMPLKSIKVHILEPCSGSSSPAP